MLYLESHINVALKENSRESIEDIAKDCRMKVTVMDNHDHLPSKHTGEYVITGHSRDREDLEKRMKRCMWLLQDCEFTMTRYKIEEALLDSRVVDEWGEING